FSNNWGEEGPSENPDIARVRLQVLKSMLASVFLSNGTPMLLAGDEFGNSQQGNNNAYCQDNELSWLDWDQAACAQGRELTVFVASLTALRREEASLSSAEYNHSNTVFCPGLTRVAWLDMDGQTRTEEGWQICDGRE